MNLRSLLEYCLSKPPNVEDEQRANERGRAQRGDGVGPRLLHPRVERGRGPRMEFSEKRYGPASRSLGGSGPRSGPEEGPWGPTGPVGGVQRCAARWANERGGHTPPAAQRQDGTGLQPAHAAILSGGACPRWWTYTVRNSAPQRGQRLASQAGNIRRSSSWAWGKWVNGS